MHYTLDCFVKAYYYGFAVFYQDCKLVYFMHHLVTLFKFKSLWMLDTFPWFMAFPPAYHCVMVGIDFKFNNFIYGFSIACYVGMQLYHKNFRNNKVHQCLMIWCVVILIPISNMAMMDCGVMWDTELMKKEVV